MIRLPVPILLAFAFTLLGGSPATAEDEPTGPVETVLERTDIPLSAHKTMLAGTYIRSSNAKEIPLGFDTRFETQLGGEGGPAFTFVQRGFERLPSEAGEIEIENDSEF
jgi:hypothetical protein